MAANPQNAALQHLSYHLSHPDPQSQVEHFLYLYNLNENKLCKFKANFSDHFPFLKRKQKRSKPLYPRSGLTYV